MGARSLSQVPGLVRLIRLAVRAGLGLAQGAAYLLLGLARQWARDYE